MPMTLSLSTVCLAAGVAPLSVADSFVISRQSYTPAISLAGSISICFPPKPKPGNCQYSFSAYIFRLMQSARIAPIRGKPYGNTSFIEVAQMMRQVAR